MNRRGFIGGLAGLTAGAVAAKTVHVQESQPKPKLRLREVLVDYYPSSGRFNSREGEEIFLKFLQRNSVQVERVLRG